MYVLQCRTYTQKINQWGKYFLDFWRGNEETLAALKRQEYADCILKVLVLKDCLGGGKAFLGGTRLH